MNYKAGDNIFLKRKKENTTDHFQYCVITFLNQHRKLKRRKAFKSTMSPLLLRFLHFFEGFPGGASGKESACQYRRHETWVQSPGQEDPLKEGMPIHSSILAWRVPWTEGPGGYRSQGHNISQRVGLKRLDTVHFFTKWHFLLYILKRIINTTILKETHSSIIPKQVFTKIFNKLWLRQLFHSLYPWYSLQIQSKGLKCLIQPYYFIKSKISGKFDQWSWKT